MILSPAGSGDGNSGLKSARFCRRFGGRRHQIGTKLTAEEIQLWKALARAYAMPLNGVLAMALERLFDEKPVPLD